MKLLVQSLEKVLSMIRNHVTKTNPKFVTLGTFIFFKFRQKILKTKKIVKIHMGYEKSINAFEMKHFIIIKLLYSN